jgi:hypothetical protein
VFSIAHRTNPNKAKAHDKAKPAEPLMGLPSHA